MEKSYWKTDRIIDAELDRLQITLEAKYNKDDNDNDYSDSTEDEKDNLIDGSLRLQFILFSYFKNFTLIQIPSVGSFQ